MTEQLTRMSMCYRTGLTLEMGFPLGILNNSSAEAKAVVLWEFVSEWGIE